MPYGSNATWRVTERLSDMNDHVVAMMSYYTDKDHYGDITISETKTPLEVIPTQPVSSSLFRKWSYLRYALKSERRPLGTAVMAASKRSRRSPVLVEMHNAQFVVMVEPYLKRFTIRKVDSDIKLDDSKPETWEPAGGRTVCNVTWNPNSKTAFLRETLTWGYEIVFKEDEGVEVPLFCFWLLNTAVKQRKHSRWYGPARDRDDGWRSL